MPISYSLLRQTCQYAANSGLRFALLTRHENLHPAASFRDIDLIVARRDLPALSASLIEQAARDGFRLFNLIQNDYSEQLFFAAPGALLHIDLMPALSYRGIDFVELPLEDHQVRQIDGMRVVAEPWLLAYSLLRHLFFSGKIDPRYRKILTRLLSDPQSGDTLKNLLADAVGRPCAINLLEALDDPALLAIAARPARRSFLRKSFLRRPLASTGGLFRHALLLARRFFAYPGLLVVLLGEPAAIDALAQGIEDAMPEFGVLRPRLAAPTLSARHRLYRALRDYTPAFIKQLWRPLEIDRLLLLDQHSQDATENLLCCRYGRHRWLSQALGCLLPKPDLWMLLDDQRQAAAPFEPQARNAQQSFATLRSLVQATENHALLDASQTMDALLAQAQAAILDAYARRTKRRFKHRF